MKKLAFGIDIGGINTAFGLVDEKGELFGESVISTRAYPNYQDYPRYVADLCEAMKLLVAAVNFDFELIGIGVGAPNANFYKGTIETPANLWKFSAEDTNKDESLRMFNFAEDIKAHFSAYLQELPWYTCICYQRRKRSHYWRDGLRQCKGYERLYYGHSRHRCWLRLCIKWRDDLRSRRFCWRVRPCYR